MGLSVWNYGPHCPHFKILEPPPLGIQCYMERISSPVFSSKQVKVKVNSFSWELHLRATGRHLPYGMTRCYLPPDSSERAPPNPSHAGWLSIYLPRRDGRLSWPSWLDSTVLAPRPGVEPATFRSRVRRPTTALPRQQEVNFEIMQSLCRLWRSTGYRSGDSIIEQHSQRALPASTVTSGVSCRPVRGVTGQDAVRRPDLQPGSHDSVPPERVRQQTWRHDRCQTTSVSRRQNSRR